MLQNGSKSDTLLLTKAEACSTLGISEPVLRHLIQSGRLDAVRIGRRVFLPRDALAAFVREAIIRGRSRERVPA